MKKNKLIMIMVAVGVIIAGGFIFVNSQKDYSSLPKIAVNMDISTKNKEKNTEILRKLAEKNDYFYTNQSYDGKTVVSIGIKNTYDSLEYDIDAPSIRYVKRERTELTDSKLKKINSIQKNDSLKKVLSNVGGEPDEVRKDNEGDIEVIWRNYMEWIVITFKNERVVEIEKY